MASQHLWTPQTSAALQGNLKQTLSLAAIASLTKGVLFGLRKGNTFGTKSLKFSVFDEKVVKCAVVQFGLDHRTLHINRCTPTWLGRTGRGIFFFQRLFHEIITANRSGKSVQERRGIREYLELSGKINWQLNKTKFGQQQTQDIADHWQYEEKTFFGKEWLHRFPCLKNQHGTIGILILKQANGPLQ